MRKFKKVLDGLTAGSSSASQQQQQQQHPPGNREPEIQETLQSEHFQLCKVSRARNPATPSSENWGRFRGRFGIYTVVQEKRAPIIIVVLIKSSFLP